MSNPSYPPIPEDVGRFIVQHIDSVPALEALLIMRRDPDREWPLEKLAGELYMEPQRLAPLVGELCVRGLCTIREEHVRVYVGRTATVELGAALDQLAEVYARHLVAVTNLIHAKPRASVRGFSDAFRLGGNE